MEEVREGEGDNEEKECLGIDMFTVRVLALMIWFPNAGVS